MSLIEFINNNVYLVGATLFVFLLALFNELKIKESNICGLTPMEAVKLINNNALIYDLRGPIDFQNKHLLHHVFKTAFNDCSALAKFRSDERGHRADARWMSEDPHPLVLDFRHEPWVKQINKQK